MLPNLVLAVRAPPMTLSWWLDDNFEVLLKAPFAFDYLAKAVILCRMVGIRTGLAYSYFGMIGFRF